MTCSSGRCCFATAISADVLALRFIYALLICSSSYRCMLSDSLGLHTVRT